MKTRHKKMRFKFGQRSTATNKETSKERIESVSQNAPLDSHNTKDKQELSSFSLKYITPQDLEKELGLSIAQQYKLRSTKFREQNAKKGKFNLPYIKQMGLIVYDRDDVVKWLDLNKQN